VEGSLKGGFTTKSIRIEDIIIIINKKGAGNSEEGQSN